MVTRTALRVAPLVRPLPVRPLLVRPLLVLPLLLLLAACGPEEDCAEGSMRDSPGGIELRASEHPTGWGSAPCAACHVPQTLHRLGCTEDVDLEAVREEVEADGEASCVRCHGDNGVGQ